MDDVATDVLGHELARQLALAEALDAALFERGVINRSGDPKSAVALRLRVSKHISRLVDQMHAIDAETRSAEPAIPDDGSGAESESEVPDPLSIELARAQFRASLNEIPPEEFDAETS